VEVNISKPTSTNPTSDQPTTSVNKVVPVKIKVPLKDINDKIDSGDTSIEVKGTVTGSDKDMK